MPTSETAVKAVSTPEVAEGEEETQNPPASKGAGNASPEGEYTEIETPNLNAVVHGQLSDITGLDIQSELECFAETSGPSENADLEVSISDTPPFTKGVSIINPNIATSSGTLASNVKVVNTAPKNVILTNLSGKEPVVLTDAQLKNLQSLSKRTLTNSGSGVVTKVIITKNPATNLPQAMPSGSASGQSTIVFSSANMQQGQQITLTPTKTITAGSLFSPTKLVQGSPSTPAKQSLLTGNKITFSPGKSPSKLTMIPVPGKSPQKIAPAPGQVITMVSKSLLSGTGVPLSTQAKHTTVSMSPSKLIIQKQPVVKSVLAQQVGVAQKSGAVPLSNVQPLSVAGSKFQYVRLVAASTSSMQGRPLAPAVMTTAGQSQMKITLPVGQNVVAKTQTTGSSQRLLLPAAPVSTPITIRPALPQIRPAPRSTSVNQLPPGTTIISSGQNMAGVQRFALVPTQYITQLQSISPASSGRQESSYVPIANSSSTAESSTATSSTKSNVNGAALSGSSNQRPRKPCNCTKSQCLKLYCDCFANGEFCHNCNCNNCFNNLDHEDERGRAIKSCLDRNPQAFHPKIGKQGPGHRRHNKGCNCKRSGCLKNYCECYEAKILCSALCKCVGCKNFEESPDRKTLMHLADAAEVRVQQQTAAKSKLSSQIADLPIRGPAGSHGERLPYTFVTKEVVEATCNCLLAQAEQCERKRQVEADEERMILEEFGRCLLQVIASADKTKDETSQ